MGEYGKMMGIAGYYLGAGYNLKVFRLEVSGSYHPALGFSPSLSLQFSRMNKK
jgi:hypothetical protein